MHRWFGLALPLLMAAAPTPPANSLSSAEIITASPAGDWRAIDPDNTLYLELPAGRVIIELAAAFAPNHVANIKAMARAHYFDAAFVVRAKDNYVVQWSQPDENKPMGAAQKTLKAEFDRADSPDLRFTPLPDPDTYAPQVGFLGDFPAARDPAERRVWLTHCYGMVGVARGNDADSGGGSALYAVIGNAPRNLDRNITLVGRVVRGIEILSVMPRGTGALGFYEKSDQRIPIRSVTVAADLPTSQRVDLESLRSDSTTFATLVEARRQRHGDWYRYASRRLDVCSAQPPTRVRAEN